MSGKIRRTVVKDSELTEIEERVADGIFAVQDFLGISQRDMSRILDLSQTTYGNRIRHASAFTIEELYRFSRHFHVGIEDIWSGEVERKLLGRKITEPEGTELFSSIREAW